jgi:hypothetical protein
VAKRLKRNWDGYIKEARKPPVELELPDGSVITIEHPSKKKIDRITKKARASDDDFAIALMGKEQAAPLLELAAEAPAGALQRMLGDVMVEFGIWTRNPFESEDGEAEDEEMGNLRSLPSLSSDTASQ